MSTPFTLDNPTLKVYYSSLIFLFDFLKPHLDVNIKLLNEEDEDEYKKLLTTSIISADTTKEFPRITREQQELVPKNGSGLDFTINQAIAILVNRADKKSSINVVRFGFTKPRTLNSQGFSLTGINSTIDYMRKSRAWLELYKRIGQEGMVFLLTNFSIFLELQNGCYVQLAGPAINKLPIPQSLRTSSARLENRKEVSETAQVASIPSATLSSQNEDTQTFTQDVCTSYEDSGGSYNASQSSLSDDISWKLMLSQDINPISKRKSDVLSFFRKLREDYSQNYASSSSSSLPSQSIYEAGSQNSDSNILFSSQSTYEIGSQPTTTSSVHDYNLNDETRNLEAMHPDKDTEEDMVSSNIEQKTEDMLNYARFKEQNKGYFLKIMEAMRDKVTEKEETAVDVNESIVSDEIEDPETQKKCLVEDVRETISKGIILSNRGVCTLSEDVEERTKEKDIVKNNFEVNNESVMQNENLEIQRKRPIDDAEKPSSKVIVLTNRKAVKVSNTNSLSSLCFTRSIMFFGSPVYNKYGKLWYGLPKEHILNVIKLSKKNNMSDILIHYIFPRQFGLKNVFAGGKISSFDTLYYVYMDRKKELNNLHCEIPDHLRNLLPYVNHIIKRHNKCHYENLLNTYCPIQTVDETNAAEKSPGYCDTYQVAKFVKTVLDFIIPPELWGGKNNKTIIYKMVGIFIERRRFEVLSLHEVLQGFKIKECEWLVSPGSKKSCNNLEALKRSEILHEFIWWIFECFVTPLLWLNFHITHNAKHKNRLFYYRQEVWSAMLKRGLEPLTSSVFEEIPSEKMAEILKGRTLGYSKLRFIPKDCEGNLRPIVDMKRSMHKTVESSFKTTRKDLKRPQSINAILNTTFQILNHEKENNPLLLSGSVFSYNEVHSCLKQYKQYLANKDNYELYFAKVDVKCCFESIDHDKLMEIIRANVLTKTQYVVNRYVAVYPKGGDMRRTHNHYVHNGEKFISFPKYAAELAQKYKNTILVENVKESYKDLDDILKLLEEHIQQNIIKAEGKYYRQRVGIPQGSMLSSLLCSIYYGVMERSELQFVKNDDGVLLHLLDDFLFISTSKENVVRFITAMHRGYPEYRFIVNNKKSMVNFDLEISGEKINKVDGSGYFPWCGLLINTHTLIVKADYSRYVSSGIADALTIKTTKSPGEFFKKKMVEFMTIKCHRIFYDTLLNTREGTLLNIYQNFLMIAMKFHHYVKGMLQRNRNFETEVVSNTIKSAYNVLRKTGNQGECTFDILNEEVMWLGARAFLQILNKKQNYHQGALTYLKKFLEDFQIKNTWLLNSIVDRNLSSVFDEIKF